MKVNTDYNKMCKKDEEHQKEWNEWFARYFDKNGVFDEKKEKEDRREKERKEKESSNIMKSIAERNCAKKESHNKIFGE